MNKPLATLETYQVLEATHNSMLLDADNLNHTICDTWHTETFDSAKLPDKWESSRVDKHYKAYLFYHDGYLIFIEYYSSNKSLKVSVSGDDIEGILAQIAWAKKTFDEVSPTSGTLRLKFWFLTPKGSNSIERHIHVPSWNDIKDNYPSATRSSLDKMVTQFKPSHGGQLLLWHGEPGTGKTYAIRAICREWEQWCSAAYIVDPDALFSEGSYLIDVLLDDDDDDDEEESKWRLLILEDAGELLSADAKAKTGQNLSRLLNLTDGLIGQGLKVLTLITTNEEISSFHPAVSRPGRSAQKIGFKPFSNSEATTWLLRNGYDKGAPSGESTLATLYALKDSYSRPLEPVRKFGFVPMREIENVSNSA